MAPTLSVKTFPTVAVRLPVTTACGAVLVTARPTEVDVAGAAPARVACARTSWSSGPSSMPEGLQVGPGQGRRDARRVGVVAVAVEVPADRGPRCRARTVEA